MSCIYKYKGKDYTKEEFYSLVSSLNFIQQEQARKFTELQERLNNKEFLEGAKNAYESTPALQQYGTQEEYNDYIARVSLGIIKNPTSGGYNYTSKVKDIVYHGANEPIEGEKFTKREGATGRGIWFSGSRKYAQIQMDRAQPSESLIGRKLRGAPTMYQVVLNIKNPKHFYDATGALLVQTPREFEKQYDRTVNDAALFHHPNSKKPETADSADQVVVFDPEQIHILGSKQDIEGFKDFVNKSNNNLKPGEQLSLFGLDIQNQANLEFHINTLNVIGQFLENVGIEQRLVTQFLSSDGNIVDGALAAANFVNGTVDIIDDINKRPEAWNKLPEEAAHWWYRLLDKNSELKDALLTSALTDRKEEELRNSLYGKTYEGVKVVGKLALDSNGNVTSKPALSAIREEAIGQLIAEAIKRIETNNGSAADYSFFKKFLEWINSIIGIFKNTTQDPFEVAAMKILSSDMSDLMTWEEYRKLNNIVNFADVLTEQSVAPIDYSIIEDIGFIGSTFMEDTEGNATSGYRFHFRDSDWIKKYGDSSPSFYTQEELDNWVSANIKEHNQRQKQILQEVRDNQVFFDRLLNKSFRKKSKFLPKTLRKYFNIIDAQNLNPLREWNISQELQQITKKLSDFEKKQIIETNGYTNIAPTLKVLPDLLQKYGRKTTPEIIKQEIEITNKLVKKEITKEQANELRQKLESKKKGNPIVLSQPIKIDGAKKQELSILNGIKEMIKLENPNLKSITAEEFVAEAHNWLKTNYLLGFANENKWLSYNVDQTFVHVKDRVSNEANPLANMTEEEINNLPFEERQRIANIVGLTKQNPDVYHNKVSLRFNDMYHLKSGHFDKSPSAWGNLTYFYTGKNKWKDAVLLHEIQNDNIEFLREFKAEKVDLETSLGKYLQQLNTDLLDNITQIESGGKKIIKNNVWSTNPPKQHLQLNYQLEQLKNLPLEQGLSQLKQNLNERIELYKSDNSVRTNVEKAQEAVEKAYSKRRIFQDFQKRGGIKSLLTKEELQNLEDILKRLNTEEVETATWSADDNVYFPDLGVRDLKQKKRDFNAKTIELQARITRELQKMYGDNAPLINLTAPAKPLPKSQRNMRIVGNGQNQRRIGGASQELNENVNWLLAYSEKKISNKLSKTIEESKKNYISARNATVANNFNVQLSKITLEQYNTLIENYKYNEDLLNRLINEQAKKDLKEKSSGIDPEDNPLISKEFYKTISPFNLPSDAKIDNSIHFGTWEFGYGTIWTSEKFPNNLYIQVENSNIGVIKKDDLRQAIIDSNKKENRIISEKNRFETLKQKALDKKAELEKNYGKIEEEVKQTLEIEMNYFTPLVHHLIQKHINQYGKDFPMYFSGYNITKLTQGNDRTAQIYAGKDEINIVTKNNFEYQKGAFYIVDDTNPAKIPRGFYKNGEIISQQEYEKAYQQATERRAKEIKFIAASQIGVVKFSDFEDTVQGLSEESNVKKLSDKQLEEGIKKLNEYKKQSKQNLDRVINTLMNISNSKPIETGAIYNAMTQISGVKLIWQDKIEGLKGNTGGYLVDLSNYNYNTPILYGLNTSKVVPINPNIFDNSEIQYSKVSSQERLSQIKDVFNENPELANIGTPEQYSQYLNSLNKPNTNPILQGNQQEQVKKFAELQERLNNKEFLEGAKNAYENSKELKSFGTQEQYNDYIARVSLGIIKNPSSGEYNYTSQVKDIVYHGTNETFDKFNKKFIGKNDAVSGYGFYFSHLTETAEIFGKVRAALIDIKRPSENSLGYGEIIDKESYEDLPLNLRNEYQLITEGKYKGNYEINPNIKTIPNESWDDFSLRLSKAAIENVKKKYDGVYFGKPIDIDDDRDIVVFEPEQIHLLGGKQDIEGFKEFVNRQNNTTPLVNVNIDLENKPITKNDIINSDVFHELITQMVSNNEINKNCK